MYDETGSKFYEDMRDLEVIDLVIKVLSVRDKENFKSNIAPHLINHGLGMYIPSVILKELTIAPITFNKEKARE